MSDEWFDEYTYQIVSKQKYLTDDLRQIYAEMTPIILSPYNPIGALI